MFAHGAYDAGEPALGARLLELGAGEVLGGVMAARDRALGGVQVTVARAEREAVVGADVGIGIIGVGQIGKHHLETYTALAAAGSLQQCVALLGLAQARLSAGLTGFEAITIEGMSDTMAPRATLTVKAGDKTFQVRSRIDTPEEMNYYRHGGILQYVLRKLAA